MRFLSITQQNGKPSLISPHHIISVEKGDDGMAWVLTTASDRGSPRIYATSEKYDSLVKRLEALG